MKTLLHRRTDLSDSRTQMFTLPLSARFEPEYGKLAKARQQALQWMTDNRLTPLSQIRTDHNKML